MEECILYNGKLDIRLEASAAELSCLLSIKTGDVGNVEIRSLLNLC